MSDISSPPLVSAHEAALVDGDLFLHVAALEDHALLTFRRGVCEHLSCADAPIPAENDTP
jgi:hypothetical protein